MARLATIVLGALFLATSSLAAGSLQCGAGAGLCPEATPCCSQYGACGVGAYCLGGCDPVHSFGLDSCVPEPQCRSFDSTFANLDKVADKTKYLGDSDKYDWVADGKPLTYKNNLLLTMEPNSVGTVLASTTYVWYGKIKATMKTSRGAGVVSAFILLSDVKDEIDFEWIGTELDTAQTNYYFQGVLDQLNGKSGTVSSDTFANFHDYEVDWKPDQITWSVDGTIIRTLKKSDTYNETTKHYNYPQTPSRVQLSLWPGGLASNAKGTIEWAGGEIDWNSQDIKSVGYYYATFKSVSIECYDPPSDAQSDGSADVSYVYNSKDAYEANVVMTDKDTVMKSLLGTGTNMTADYPDSTQSGSAKSSSSAAESVPGLTGAGVGSSSGSTGDGSSGSSSSGSGQGVSDAGDSGTGSGSNTWSQDGASTTGTGNSGAEEVKVVRGSVLAMVLAVVGVMIL